MYIRFVVIVVSVVFISIFNDDGLKITNVQQKNENKSGIFGYLAMLSI